MKNKQENKLKRLEEENKELKKKLKNQEEQIKKGSVIKRWEIGQFLH